MHSVTLNAVRDTAVHPPDTGTAQRISRQALHHAVMDRLRKMITEGVLLPGAHLNERALCEQLGVSRTPLREALKMLAVERLIELLPNRGARVVMLSASDIADAFELLSGLEALAGELACERITQAEIDEIQELHATMAACHANGDLSGYFDCNQRIHDRINAAARNPALTQTYQSVNQRLQALRFRSNLHAGKWEQAVDEHVAMLRALHQRDGAALGRLLRTHLMTKCATVLANRRVAA
ncbi:GntR family transcriptional regulator [Pandoraea apista]|uniref:GntR family transcriptional regulator n=1 Tax=Pandoraea apista TaxID=93218 RepID=A0A0B5F4V2_9BURK|nr:GntR family transcriptional regulator [Pandoraea apista]AJE99244.1 GntR family transcriptional regulator [Pandoraea apista]AKH73353.1 GntR family transcriptional regulator [Pandoraea apista]AKI61899.1 GntR family transcriptional regulator [Pandoraea apista]ALS64972.1 GntR family transcriptional regulator [Pandoraea apista]AVF40164.1 GntR family transcriptional regulator [Pandoraea apista]